MPTSLRPLLLEGWGGNRSLAEVAGKGPNQLSGTQATGVICIRTVTMAWVAAIITDSGCSRGIDPTWSMVATSKFSNPSYIEGDSRSTEAVGYCYVHCYIQNQIKIM